MSIASQVIALMYQLPAATHSVEKQKDIDVPSENGTVLKTDVFFPRGDGPHPTIFMRTPYGRFGFAMVAEIYAERGYITVLQAVRGTDGSSGEFSPLIHERADGLATLDWIKKQSWFDGRLALNGPSYLGYCALAIADALPEKSALTIKATSADFERIVFPGGAFHMQLWISWIQTIYGLQEQLLGMTLRMVSGDVERRTIEIGKTLPIQDADIAAVGRKVPFWRNWMENAIGNHEFWQERNHTHRLGAKTPPTCFVTGWHDLMADGHLADYQRMVDAGHTPHLIIGPWHHTQNELQGESLRQTLIWLDAHLRENTNALPEKPVRILMNDTTQWLHLDQFPPPTQQKTLNLGAKGTLGEQEDAPLSSVNFRYDPQDPTPSVGGAVFAFAGAGPQDNQELEARSDVITFSTAPLSEKLTLIGNARLKLFAKTTNSHADFFARLTDVTPDGKSLNVADGIVRLTPDSIETDENGWVEISITLGAMGHIFKRGHQLRLQISGGAHPRFARNLGTDENVAIATKMVPSTREIILGGDKPSQIHLPVWQAS